MPILETQRQEAGRKTLKRGGVLYKIVAQSKEYRVAELRKRESLYQHAMDATACKDLK